MTCLVAILSLRSQSRRILYQGSRSLYRTRAPGCSTPGPVASRWRRHYSQQDHLRGKSSLPIDDPKSWDKVRNVGIVAHIDAGKTTSTERALFYSGLTSTIGEVDSGSTVTDYLPVEKERGITITSAAITFQWSRGDNVHTINLIDTPGHTDFTFEVERSIRVLDGVVVILDGTKGVEAQTEKVWQQARNYNIPSLVFVNKFDRPGADFSMCVKDVYVKLRGAKPAVLQIPLLESGASRNNETFNGVVDIIGQNVIRWKQETMGKEMEITPVSELTSQPKIQEEALKAREALVELLTEIDETLIERWDAVGNVDKLTADDLRQSVKRCVLKRAIVPVFVGSALKNIGVQPVLDGVLAYLPSPGEVGEGKVPAKLDGKTAQIDVRELGELCALVFKVVHDAKLGFMVFVRVYSGVLTKGQHLYNTNTEVGAPALRLLRMFANHSVDIDAVHAGHIGVIFNYPNARTGDTLISGKVLGANPAKHKGRPPPKDSKQAKDEQKNINPSNNPLLNMSLQLQPMQVPPPVFVMTVEPYSGADRHHLEDALDILIREDPSLRLTTDPDSGQMLLSGMGELHLEISQGRLINELKAKARLSELRVSYREVISGSPSERGEYLMQLDDKRSYAAASVSLEPIREGEPPTAPDSAFLVVTDEDDRNEILVSLDEKMWLPHNMTPGQAAAALAEGCKTGLMRGLQHYPLCWTRVSVTISPEDVDVDTALSSLQAAARSAVIAAIKQAGTHLMEPVMRVKLNVPEGDIGIVQGDITSDGGSVLELNPYEEEDDEQSKLDPEDIYSPPSSYISGTIAADRGLRDDAVTKMATMYARMPLKKLIGYAGKLRSMTRGKGGFVMEYDRFVRMTDARVRALTHANEG